MDIKLRVERAEDYENIDRLVAENFRLIGREASLIRRLRESKSFVKDLALVAEIDGELVGYILFTENQIEGPVKEKYLYMAPLSVARSHQNRGIGSRLVHHGLERAKSLGHRSVVVLGNRNYYRRFGFLRASSYKIRSELKTLEDVFLVLELKKDALKDLEGIVKYPREFFI